MDHPPRAPKDAKKGPPTSSAFCRSAVSSSLCLATTSFSLLVHVSVRLDSSWHRDASAVRVSLKSDSVSDRCFCRAMHFSCAQTQHTTYHRFNGFAFSTVTVTARQTERHAAYKKAASEFTFLKLCISNICKSGSKNKRKLAPYETDGRLNFWK